MENMYTKTFVRLKKLDYSCVILRITAAVGEGKGTSETTLATIHSPQRGIYMEGWEK